MSKRPFTNSITIRFVMPEAGDVEWRIKRVIAILSGDTMLQPPGVTYEISTLSQATNKEWADADGHSYLNYISLSRYCGLNADWSASSWWFPSAGSRHVNATSGDIYVLDDEDDNNTYSVVRRWYADHGFSDPDAPGNDTFEIIAQNVSAYDAANVASTAVLADNALYELAWLVYEEIAPDLAAGEEDQAGVDDWDDPEYIAKQVLDAKRLETKIEEVYGKTEKSAASEALAAFRGWSQEKKIEFIKSRVL